MLKRVSSVLCRWYASGTLILGLGTLVCVRQKSYINKINEIWYVVCVYIYIYILCMFSV
jgi:hypothetical protein